MKVKNLKEFHKEVCKRDNYTCQVCGTYYGYGYCFQGDVNSYVCGHHRKSQASAPELRLETDNGVCIDYDCHHKVHNGEIKL